MRRPFSARRCWKDNDAVSTIIGAILVAAMVATVFAHVQLYHAPVWEERAEERHGNEVRQALADFHGALVGPGGVTAGAAASIPLRAETSVFGPSGSGAHRVEFEDRVAPLRLELDRFILPNETLRNSPSAWDEHWVSDFNPITGVYDVYNFRLRIQQIGGQGNNDDGFVRVIAKDASDRYVGNFSVLQIREPPETHVFIETTDGQEVIHYDNPAATHLTNPISPYWVDILDAQYRYDGILATAAKPLTIMFEQEVLEAEYTISYSTKAANGSDEVVGGIGDPVPVDLSFDGGGRLVHHAENVHRVRQTWVLEHGALILAQADGEVFLVPPPFQVRERAGWAHVAGALPVVEGDAGGIGGTAAARLDARPVDGQTWNGLSSLLAVNLTTEYPDLWRAFFQERLADAGAVASNHTVTSGADWVRMELGGPATDPLAPDLSLSLRIPRFQLSLGG